MTAEIRQERRSELPDWGRILNCDLTDPELNRRPRKGCGFVYMYTFENGMRYVGQTVKTIVHRTKYHTYTDSLVDRAIRKGRRFTIEVLCECPRECLDGAERFCIAYFGTLHPQGYNLTAGGQVGHTVAEEVRRKVSRSLKERYSDPAERGRNMERIRRAQEFAPKTPVICLETKRTYDTMADALRDIGRDPDKSSSMTAALRYDKQYKAHGYHWVEYTEHNMEYADELLKAMTEFESEVWPITHRQHVIRMRGMGGKFGPRTRMIHLESGSVTETGKAMADRCGIDYDRIVDCITGKMMSVNGQHFARYEEWMDDADARKAMIDCFDEWDRTKRKRVKDMRYRSTNPHRPSRKIMCVDDGIVYQSHNDAIRRTGASSSALRDAVKIGSKVQGKYWVLWQSHYDDMIDDIKACLDDWRNTVIAMSRRKTNKLRKENKNTTIRCLNNDTVYRTVKEASDDLGIGISQIYRVIRGNLTHAHGYQFERIEA